MIAILIIIYFSFISLGLPDALLGSAWPSMYGAMQAPISYAGILSMIIAGGTVVSSILSEKVIKQFGTGLVTAVSVLMTAAALFGFSISDNFIMLCIYAVPLGLGAGSVDAALNNYVALHYKAMHMSWLHCFWGIGAATGPVIMSICLLNSNSWQWGYRFVSIIQFGLATVLLFSLSLWKKADKKTKEPDKINKKPLRLIELSRLPGAKPALIAFFCYCGLESTTGLWGSSYMVIAKGMQPEIAARWISLYYLGITLGRFFSGFLTIKLNHRQMVRLGQGLIIAGIVFFILPFGNVFLLIGIFIIGIGCAPIYPSLLHQTPMNFGKQHSQAIMGIQMACAYIGATLMPPLFGLIAEYISYSLLPLYLGVLLVIMALMVIILNKKVDKLI